MLTIGAQYLDLISTPCPVCGDLLRSDHSAFMPTWSDENDNVVCFDCYTKGIA